MIMIARRHTNASTSDTAFEYKPTANDSTRIVWPLATCAPNLVLGQGPTSHVVNSGGKTLSAAAAERGYY